jgi:probable phosphoglycerate mutase
MKTTVLFIRHGQTEWNLSKRAQGQLDIPLNEAGRRQSELLAQRLIDWPIRAIYSSDLSRARMTAQIIGRASGIRPVLEVALRERHGGIFQGHTGEELERRYPEALQAFLDHGRPPPGAESNLALARRAAPVLERIATAHRGETIALITHGGTLRVLLAHVMGLAVDGRLPFKVSHNTGLSIAEKSDGQWVVTLLNDCCHLQEPDAHLAAGAHQETAGDDDGYALG